MRIRNYVLLTAFLAVFGVSGMAALPGANVARAAEQTEEQAALEVVMSQKSGVYAEEFLLSLDSPGSAAVYYTLDGSSPVSSETRKKYEEPISVRDRSGSANYLSAVDPVKFDTAYAQWDSASKTFGDSASVPKADEVDKGTVVKAVAQDASGNYGTVCTNTYFVGTVAEHIKGAKESAQAAGIPLSVMSISVDYDDLFDYEKGIYVRGKCFDEALKAYIEDKGTSGIRDKARNLPANYSQRGRDWERNAHIDYFETDGTGLDCKLQQDCGIRIQGNYSRSDLMKGFRLYARDDYGKKNFKYPFFENAKDDKGEVIEKYKKIVLRNGGNYAFYGTKYNDAYWQSMLQGLDCETQSSRVCVVYLDGEYWGLYILQQDYDDNYFEITHGVDKDSVVVYKASDAEEDAEYGYKIDEGNLPEGVTDVNYFYSDLLKFFETHDSLEKDEDYQEFVKLVDPQSVMDYFAVNVWVNNKWDWPDKNWSMWKSTVTDTANEYGDGRWRFCIYDLDFGGCGGYIDATTNTIKEGNYETDGKGLLGQNKTRPLNPALQCFILLMSNKSFREEFKAELEDFGKTILEWDNAVDMLDKFKSVYEPLFLQFYTRYFGAEDAPDMVVMTEYGYAGYDNLKMFVMNRSDTIPFINNYLDEFYKAEDTPTPPDNGGSEKPGDKVDKPGTKKTIKTLSVTAKKGRKAVRVKTIAKAKVTVSMNKKIIVKGKKKVSKVTVTTPKNGTVTVKLSKKLAKGVKVTVKAAKSGYQTKSKTVKVK